MAAFIQPILEAVFRDTQAEALRELQFVLDSKLLLPAWQAFFRHQPGCDIDARYRHPESPQTPEFVHDR